jgi:amidohydrolase
MVNSFKNKLIAIRRMIHKHPELGNQEFKTSTLIEKTLRNAGIKTKRITKTGVIGIIEGGRHGKCIALRGDMDALPIGEKTGKPYASCVPGVMHACGHDANSTMVLGAALLVAARKAGLKGTAKFIFQPNEESSGGAKQMIAAGALRNPVPDAIIGIHVYPWLPKGILGLKYGEMMAAVDKFTIEVIGEGGHGAYPYMGKDAVVIASHVIQALQSVISREINPVEPAVITIGMIEGGEKFNILAGKVRLTGTVRTLNEALHRRMPKIIERKVSGITKAFGAKYKFEYENLGPSLRNSRNILELCRKAAKKVAGLRQVVLEQPSMGGEDFSEYLKTMPGCFLYLGSAGKQSFAWHHEKFDIDEKVLPIGAKLLSEIVTTFLV